MLQETLLGTAQATPAKYRRSLTRVAAIIFALFALYFGWLAGGITVHYYDGFQYLNSAKALAGLNSYYDYTRPPVFQMLLAPLMLAYRAGGAHFWLERAPYIFMLMVNTAALWSVWRLLRAGLGEEVALIMTILLLLNRVVFHYVPFVMPDLLAMGLVAAMAHSCHRLVCTEQRRDAVLTGCWFGLAVSTKHYLAPLCLAITIFLLLEWVVRDEGRIRLRPRFKQIGWLAITGLCSAGTFLLLHRVAFWLVPEYRNQSLFELLRSIFIVVSGVNKFGETGGLAANVAFTTKLLLQSLSIPLLLAAAVGCVLAIRSQERLARLLAIIAAVHIIVLTVALPHPEVRYFLKVYPAIYYFVGFALKRGLEIWSGWGTELAAHRRARLIGAGLLLILLASIGRGTVIEARSFAKNSYRDDVLVRLGHYVKEQTGRQNRVIWVGDWLTISPNAPDLAEEAGFQEDYYYFFQANANAVAYYSDRPGYTLYPYPPVQRQVDSNLQRGDLIIFNPGEKTSEPIRVYAFERFWRFEQESANAGTDMLVEPHSRTRLSLTQTKGGFELQGEGPPFLLWEIALRRQGNIFMNAMILPKLPYVIGSSAPITVEDISALVMIPLGMPQNLFYHY